MADAEEAYTIFFLIDAPSGQLKRYKSAMVSEKENAYICRKMILSILEVPAPTRLQVNLKSNTA